MAPIPSTLNARRTLMSDWDIVAATAVAFGVIVCAALFVEFLKWLGRLVRRFIMRKVFPLKELKCEILSDPAPKPKVDPYIASTEALTDAVNANTASLNGMITAMSNRAPGSNG